jgi:hypothetical protein
MVIIYLTDKRVGYYKHDEKSIFLSSSVGLRVLERVMVV